jgi:hypothetical protein
MIALRSFIPHPTEGLTIPEKPPTPPYASIGIFLESRGKDLEEKSKGFPKWEIHMPTLRQNRAKGWGNPRR